MTIYTYYLFAGKKHDLKGTDHSYEFFKIFVDGFCWLYFCRRLAVNILTDLLTIQFGFEDTCFLHGDYTLVFFDVRMCDKILNLTIYLLDFDTVLVVCTVYSSGALFKKSQRSI
jgi:hypothetical protein